MQSSGSSSYTKPAPHRTHSKVKNEVPAMSVTRSGEMSCLVTTTYSFVRHATILAAIPQDAFCRPLDISDTKGAKIDLAISLWPRGGRCGQETKEADSDR